MASKPFKAVLAILFFAFACYSAFAAEEKPAQKIKPPPKEHAESALASPPFSPIMVPAMPDYHHLEYDLDYDQTGSAVARDEMEGKFFLLYNKEKVPITLGRDISLLVSKKTGSVEYIWLQKEQGWAKVEGEAQRYLQKRYEDKNQLWVEVEEYRALKEMQNRLNEMQRSSSQEVQRASPTRPGRNP